MATIEPTLWNKFTDFMGGTVIKTITEIHMLMPDSILFGSLLLFFLTQNMAFGVFAVFIFETVLSHKLVSWLFGQTVGTPSSRPIDIKCRSGFKTPQFSVQRMFSHESYPSYGVFSISAIGAYLLMATQEFSSTLKAMGPEWEARIKASYSFIGLVLAAFMLARFWSGCDSASEIAVSFVFAVVTGLIFFQVNKALFGVEAVNFLGLPYMVSKESQGAPIYVCATEKEAK